MNQLIEFFRESYFTSFICLLISALGLIISILHRKRHVILEYFPYYFFAHVLANISFSIHDTYFSESVLHSTLLNLNTFVDYALTIIEFLVFIYVFEKTIIQKSKFLKALRLLFLALCLLLLFQDLFRYRILNQSTLHNVFTLQASFLIIACITYYLHIFRLPPYIKLREDPVFWIATGLIFFMICTLPLSLAINYIRTSSLLLYQQLFPIFYIFYCLLFLMIINAFLCKPAQNT
jgi:hypothetical protein